jgi:hypothetical protein
MGNAIGTTLSSPPDVSSTKEIAISEELVDGPDAKPIFDHSQLHINVPLKDRSASPPLSSLRVARSQLHAILNLTNFVFFVYFSIEPAGSCVAPINVNSSQLPAPSVLGQAYETELDFDPVSVCVTRVLGIIPNVEPDHLTQLVTKSISTHGSGVLEHVLHVLFEDSKYPKTDAKGKGKRKRADDEDKNVQAGSSKQPKVDFSYADLSRAFKGGPDYLALALV